MKIDFAKLAEKAYTAYGKTTNFQNFLGDPMPTWGDLPEKIQSAWHAAAKQVHDDVKKSLDLDS